MNLPFKSTLPNFQCGHFHQKAILQHEEGRDLMKQALLARFPKKKEKKKRALSIISPPIPADSREERVLHQEINILELSSTLQNPKGWSTRDINTFQNFINASDSDIVSVVYARQYAGRWYARGTAQLQNCKKSIRARALQGMGFGLDICAS